MYNFCHDNQPSQNASVVAPIRKWENLSITTALVDKRVAVLGHLLHEV